ncbi:hypothetical protein KC19_6G040000 [Ceratodon purpureus]|uniref:Uncharacterized protein n=1 Tax=Ceratodon purpureus TaxID=3225 RepID=A0A8T0HDG6_CERPU|nr:hypothetical protein KC19_6G040000 [Ceratodon purpureus]
MFRYFWYPCIRNVLNCSISAFKKAYNGRKLEAGSCHQTGVFSTFSASLLWFVAEGCTIYCFAELIQMEWSHFFKLFSYMITMSHCILIRWFHVASLMSGIQPSPQPFQPPCGIYVFSQHFERDMESGPNHILEKQI